MWTVVLTVEIELHFQNLSRVSSVDKAGIRQYCSSQAAISRGFVGLTRSAIRASHFKWKVGGITAM